jgi:hypothetical protein
LHGILGAACCAPSALPRVILGFDPGIQLVATLYFIPALFQAIKNEIYFINYS